MSVTVTENAAKQIQNQLQKRGQGLGLKLGVKKSGCSGFAYTLDFADELGEGDTIFEAYGIKVIVNEKDLEFLGGIEVDYRKEGVNSAFQFSNPNVTGTCGCGESFTV